MGFLKVGTSLTDKMHLRETSISKYYDKPDCTIVLKNEILGDLCIKSRKSRSYDRNQNKALEILAKEDRRVEGACKSFAMVLYFEKEEMLHFGFMDENYEIIKVKGGKRSIKLLKNNTLEY